MKGVTRYQLELITTLSRLETASGRLTDFDQLLETLSWTPSKESAQFTMRALVAKGFIAKCALESRRGRNRVCYRLLAAGKAVLDPRPAVEKPEKKTEEKAEEKAREPFLPGMLEDLLSLPEVDLFFRELLP